MAQDILIEWTKGPRERREIADVTIFEDGRVRLAPRLGGGEHRLSPKVLMEVRRFVIDEQQFHKIDEDALKRDVQAAIEQYRSHDGPAATFVAGPQMDSGTTHFRSIVAGSPHEVAYPDLVGDAQIYPGVETLQRLRRIELKILELAEELSARGS